MGCAPEYSAQVANHSQRAVFVAIFEQSARSGTRMLANGKVSPQEEETVGPGRGAAEGSQVFAVIDTSPNPKTGRRMTLSKGVNKFEVVQFGDDPKAAVQVNQLP